MSICESLVYGRRRGFVYLRYVAMVFFFLSQIATYFVILQVLQQTSNAITALDQLDVVGIITAVTSFRIPGKFGTFIGVLQSLGALVVPLYFIATVSFVLNLNKREIGKVVRRTAWMALLLAAAEFMVYTILVGFVMVLVSALFSDIAAEENIVLLIEKILQTLNAQATLPVQSASELLAYAENFTATQVSLIVLRNMPSFNIFLDELLCLLLCLFFCMRPKRMAGRLKLALYRALGVLPILFIGAAFAIHGLTQMGVIQPNLTLLSILPAKKLPQFLFMGCILYQNHMDPVRELRLAEGLRPAFRCKKEFRAGILFAEGKVQARRRALRSAVFLSVCLLLVCAADLCCSFLPSAAKWGMGKSYFAALCIPFLFFFDDRKPTRKKDYSIFLAVYMAVIAVIVLIYLLF